MDNPLRILSQHATEAAGRQKSSSCCYFACQNRWSFDRSGGHAGQRIFRKRSPSANFADASQADERFFERQQEYKRFLERQQECKVGAAPLTRKCLESPSVQHEMGEDGDDDPMLMLYRNVQQRNDMCNHHLNVLGFSSLLQAKIKEKRKSVRESLTVPHSKERIEALAKASTHGDKFYVMGGGHQTHDDIFKAAELNNRKREIGQLEKEKVLRLDMERREREAVAILEKELPVSQLTNAHLEKLLAWHGVQKNKMGKADERRQKWMVMKDQKKPPPQFEKWTEEDERKLEELKSSEINISDTALGRLQQTNMRQFKATFNSMSPGSKREYIRKLQKSTDQDSSSG